MNSNSVLFILFWILVMLIIIHNCHKIINFVQENFDTQTRPPTDETDPPPTDESDPPPTDEPDPPPTDETDPIETYHNSDKSVIINLKELITGISTLTDLGDLKQTEIITNIKKTLEATNIELSEDPIINEELEIEIIVKYNTSQESIDTFVSELKEILQNYRCPSNSCPLASVLSSYPNIGDKWGNEANECVKVSNSLDANCARCPPGTFIDYSNINDVCSPCPKNQYSDSYNQLQCKPCEGTLEGASKCGSNTGDSSGNTNNSQSDINLFEPTLDVDRIVNQIYDGNIKKFKQNQALKHRIQKLQNKLSNYAYLEKEIYKKSLA